MSEKTEDVKSICSKPGSALEIICTDRDIWKARALAAEALVQVLERRLYGEPTGQHG